ncbi:Protein LPD-2 [Aphelenchoides avenae]|nr:Protein LPD-2 [Aphelenchus avenae]
MTQSDDVARFKDVVAECARSSEEALAEIRKFHDNLLENAEADDLDGNGISLLELKNHDMTAYMLEMSVLLSKISMGESIEGSDSIDRLVKYRTVLEKIRPMEKKLKNQIEKLLAGDAHAENGTNGTVAKPRPDMLMLDDEDGEDDDDNDQDGTEKSAKPKKYVAPKIMPMQYDEDENARGQRLLEKAKRRALQSSLVQDLRAQYSEAPEEVVDEFRRNDPRDKERQRYEENYFVRLRMSKQEKHAERQKRQSNVLDSLLSFGDYRATDRAAPNGDSRKRKHTDAGDKGSKKFKKAAGGKKFKKSSGGKTFKKKGKKSR